MTTSFLTGILLAAVLAAPAQSASPPAVDVGPTGTIGPISRDPAAKEIPPSRFRGRLVNQGYIYLTGTLIDGGTNDGRATSLLVTWPNGRFADSTHAQKVYSVSGRTAIKLFRLSDNRRFKVRLCVGGQLCKTTSYLIR